MGISFYYLILLLTAAFIHSGKISYDICKYASKAALVLSCTLCCLTACKTGRGGQLAKNLIGATVVVAAAVLPGLILGEEFNIVNLAISLILCYFPVFSLSIVKMKNSKMHKRHR